MEQKLEQKMEQKMEQKWNKKANKKTIFFSYQDYLHHYHYHQS